MHPELPFLAAAAIAVTGATIRDGKFPALGRVAIGTVALVIVASASTGTRLEPLVKAFGMLLVLVAVISATNASLKKAKSK